MSIQKVEDIYSNISQEDKDQISILRDEYNKYYAQYISITEKMIDCRKRMQNVIDKYEVSDDRLDQYIKDKEIASKPSQEVHIIPSNKLDETTTSSTNSEKETQTISQEIKTPLTEPEETKPKGRGRRRTTQTTEPATQPVEEANPVEQVESPSVEEVKPTGRTGRRRVVHVDTPLEPNAIAETQPTEEAKPKGRGRRRVVHVEQQ